jgi:hypothetical protein
MNFLPDFDEQVKRILMGETYSAIATDLVVREAAARHLENVGGNPRGVHVYRKTGLMMAEEPTWMTKEHLHQWEQADNEYQRLHGGE